MHHPLLVVILVACEVPVAGIIGYFWGAIRWHGYMADGWNLLAKRAADHPITASDVIDAFGTPPPGS